MSDTTQRNRRLTRLAAPLAGLVLLGLGMSAQAGVDVRAPFTHVGVGQQGVNVQAPFTGVHVTPAGYHRDDHRRHDSRRYDHRHHRNNRYGAYRHHGRYHRGYAYGHNRHRYDRYNRRYADHYRDERRHGWFGRW